MVAVRGNYNHLSLPPAQDAQDAHEFSDLAIYPNDLLMTMVNFDGQEPTAGRNVRSSNRRKLVGVTERHNARGMLL